VAETLPTTQNIDPTSPYAVLVRDAFFRWETPPPEKESSKSNSKLKPSDKKDRKNVKADKKATRKAAKAGEHVIVAASGGSGAGENDAVIEDVAPGEGNIPRTKEIRNEGEGSGQEEMKRDEEKEVFSMAGVNLSIPKGSLTAIVGSVGCGKSSLLQGTPLSIIDTFPRA
jgi:ABC-type transport system involved in cytochrome bd biosynthesis fused ATPase/permease subunit